MSAHTHVTSQRSNTAQFVNKLKSNSQNVVIERNDQDCEDLYAHCVGNIGWMYWIAGRIVVMPRNRKIAPTMTVTIDARMVCRGHSKTRTPMRNSTKATWSNTGREAMIIGTRHACKPR